MRTQKASRDRIPEGFAEITIEPIEELEQRFQGIVSTAGFYVAYGSAAAAASLALGPALGLAFLANIATNDFKPEA